MPTVKVVPLEHVHGAWPSVKSMVAESIKYAQGDYDIGHVEVYVSSGQWMLLIAQADDGKIKGAATVEFFNRPTSRVAFVTSMGGKFIICRDTFRQLSEICKAYGATRIEAAVRESMARLCKRVNLEEKYRIVGAKL